MSGNGSAYTSAEGLPVGGDLVPPGHHRIVRVPVLTDLDSSEIGLYIHAVVGATPGILGSCAGMVSGAPMLASGLLAAATGLTSIGLTSTP